MSLKFPLQSLFHTLYLQSYFNAPFAQDHITLLLSCYTKIKDDAQINALLDAIALNPNIKSVNKSGSGKAQGPDGSVVGNLFNAEQAISILHTAGYTGVCCYATFIPLVIFFLPC